MEIEDSDESRRENECLFQLLKQASTGRLRCSPATVLIFPFQIQLLPCPIVPYNVACVPQYSPWMLSSRLLVS